MLKAELVSTTPSWSGHLCDVRPWNVISFSLLEFPPFRKVVVGERSGNVQEPHVEAQRWDWVLLLGKMVTNRTLGGRWSAAKWTGHVNRHEGGGSDRRGFIQVLLPAIRPAAKVSTASWHDSRMTFEAWGRLRRQSTSREDGRSPLTAETRMASSSFRATSTTSLRSLTEHSWNEEKRSWMQRFPVKRTLLAT